MGRFQGVLFGDRSRHRPLPTAEPLPLIDNLAEQLCRFLRIVGRGVSIAVTEFDIGALAGLGKYGVSVGQSGKGGGVEVRKRVKGIAFQVAA